MVLLDENFDATEIYEAERPSLARSLFFPGFAYIQTMVLHIILMGGIGQFERHLVSANRFSSHCRT